MKIAKEKLDALKKKYGQIFEINVKHEKEEYNCVLRKPSRDEYFAFFSFSVTSPMKGLELILKSCWLEGDDEIMDIDPVFFGALTQVGELVEVYEATVKKN